MAVPLSVEGVGFGYRSTLLLRGVSLEMPAGCFVGLVGPNGSGKTTLLRIAAGLMKPSAGRVSLFGRPVEGMSRAEIARRVTLLPQDPLLPPTFTAWEMVMMGRTPYLGFLGREGPADLAAVDRAMRRAQCYHLAARLVGELSGGERQRVVMARALAQEPEVLLLDEPTTHMDVSHQIATVQLVSEMVAGGVAALGVFHDLNLAARYCDRLAVLSRGKIVALGKPAEILTAEMLREVFEVDLCLVTLPNGRIAAVP